MKTAIKNRVSFIFTLLFIACFSNSIMAQEYIIVNYKEKGKPSTQLYKDKVKEIKFLFRNSIQESYYDIDTVYLSASSGYCGRPGEVSSNAPISAKTDCDWAEVVLREDTVHNPTGFDHYYSYAVYAKANKSGKERSGNIIFESEGAECAVKPIVQRAYVSSLEGNINTPLRWDSEPIKLWSTAYEWNDTTGYIVIAPNFGISVVSVPSWIEEYNLFDKEGDENFREHSPYSTLSLKFKKNNSAAERKGFIIFSDINGEQLIVELKQEGLGYSNIPSEMTQGYLIYGSQVHETDMAYPAYMIAQTELLGDMFPGGDSGYDWYYTYNSTERNMGDNSYPSYLSWHTFYKFIKSANEIIAATDLSDKSITNKLRGAAGVAHAYRAFNYYMLTVLFEPKANIYTDCRKVLGLTVPFVTETTDNEVAKNNPRATHDEMIEFILNDLTIAEECLKNYTPENKMVPNLAVAYGIRAKVHMWDEDYENAAKYARLAIETSGATPVTDAQWNDVATGFNTANQAWMWYIHYDAENMGNLCNFTGWMSGEADWGYSSLSRPVIDRSLYEKIPNTDFRKKTFIDPDRENNKRATVRDDEWYAEAPDYLSLKFRCKNQDYETYSIGGAVDVPVMRVEEMYFIEAEAVAHTQGVAAGKALLEDFMKAYRNPEYSCMANELRDFQLEVLTQMRIEFWGEGNAFPQAKRIQPGVMQNYTGTNAPDNYTKVNCAGMKPTWNMVIPISAVQANVALEGMNNPNPTGTVLCPSEENVYAPGNEFPEEAAKKHNRQ